MLYSSFDSKIGAPEDLQKLIANPEGIEIDKAVEIPQKEVAEVKTAPSTAHTTKVKEPVSAPQPQPVVPPQPQESQKAAIPEDLSSGNFMPIKALNTFTRDWMIKARVANKNMRTTQKGG